MNLQVLERMRDTDVLAANPAGLADIRDVDVDTSLPYEGRLLDYLDQVKNPYCVKYGEAVVKISFADTDATLEDRLEAYLTSL